MCTSVSVSPSLSDILKRRIKSSETPKIHLQSSNSQLVFWTTRPFQLSEHFLTQHLNPAPSSLPTKHTCRPFSSAIPTRFLFVLSMNVFKSFLYYVPTAEPWKEFLLSSPSWETEINHSSYTSLGRGPPSALSSTLYLLCTR